MRMPIRHPTVRSPAQPLLPFHTRFVRNPWCGVPQAVYEAPLVVYRRGHAGLVWVTDPKLTEHILRP
jgi:hypothetical protein